MWAADSACMLALENAEDTLPFHPEKRGTALFVVLSYSGSGRRSDRRANRTGSGS